MEKCEKNTLYEKIEARNVSYAVRKETVYCIAKGLQHLKEKGILHRDLKPQNILYRGDVPVILDFGVSMRISPNKSNTQQSVKNVGTNGWRAPETSMEKGMCTFASDIYAAGLVNFYALTNGKHPFGEESNYWQTFIDTDFVKRNLKALEEIDVYDWTLAFDMIELMLNPNPKDRPTVEAVLENPFFWSVNKRLNFISDTYKSIEDEITIISKLNKGEGKYGSQIQEEMENWKEKLSFTLDEMQMIQDNFNQQNVHVVVDIDAMTRKTKKAKKAKKAKEYEDSVTELLSFIRNRYDFINKDKKEGTINQSEDQLLKYFFDRFPHLFVYVYCKIKDNYFDEKKSCTNILAKYFPLLQPKIIRNEVNNDSLEIEWEPVICANYYRLEIYTNNSEQKQPVFKNDVGKKTEWIQGFDDKFGCSTSYYAVVIAVGEGIKRSSTCTDPKQIGIRKSIDGNWSEILDQLPTMEQLFRDAEKSDEYTTVNPGWKQIGTEIEYDTASRYNGYSNVFNALRKSGAEPQEAVVKFVTNFNIEDKERMQIYRKREIDNHWDAHTHDNVVTYFQSGVCEYEEKDAIFILMEKCDKKNLSERIKEESLPYIKRAETVKCIARGLQHLKERRILHRDLKPQNILYKGDVGVISDFGLSKKISPEKSNTFQSIPYLGTIGWCAPEIYSDHAKSSFAADIYAAGLVFYFALSNGKHPYGNDSPTRQAYINVDLNCNLKPLYENPDGKVAYDLISLMLSRDPKARPTIEEVLEHPFFWDVNKKIKFYAQICGIIEYRTNKEINSNIFSSQNEVVEAEIENWKDNLPLTDAEKTNIQYNFEKRDFDEITVQDRVFESFARQIPDSVTRMVRFIRNRFTHSGEDTGKDKIDLTDEQLWEFFNSRCPHLLIHTYHEIKTYYKTKPASDPEYFEDYFKKEDKKNTK